MDPITKGVHYKGLQSRVLTLGRTGEASVIDQRLPLSQTDQSQSRRAPLLLQEQPSRRQSPCYWL